MRGVLGGLVYNAGVGVGLVGGEWLRISTGIEEGLRLGLLRGQVLCVGLGVGGSGVPMGTFSLSSSPVGVLESGVRGVGLVGVSVGQLALGVELGLRGAVFTVGSYGLPYPVVGTFTGVGVVFGGRLADDLRLGLRGVGLVGGFVDQLAEGLGLGLTGYFGGGVAVGALSGVPSIVPVSVPMPLRIVG